MESPMGVGKFPTYDGLCRVIRELAQDYSPIALENDLKKIEVGGMVLYWYEKDGVILLGCELHIRPQGLVVSITGKNPDLPKGSQPYASDLYVKIIQDTNMAIRLLSDEQLSDEGKGIWKRLYDAGLCISVYDRSEKTAGRSYKKLRTLDDFESYHRDNDPSYMQYQYILAKNKSAALSETFAFFNLRAMRERAGLALDDYKR
jgi:hypothetical protein